MVVHHAGHAGAGRYRYTPLPVTPSIDVLQVITTTDRRGAETFAVDLGEALTARGRRVETVALTTGSGSSLLPVEVLGARRLGYPTLANLRRRARRARVVVAHGSTTLPAAAIALAGGGPPFVYRNIGDPEYWSRRWSRRARSAALLSRAAAVVSLTDGTGSAVHDRYRVPLTKIHAIPKGVPAARFPVTTAETRRKGRLAYGLPPDAGVALYLGALSAEKNVALAVAAVARVPALHLLVVGDGPERPRIERLAAEAARGRVHVAGPTSDPVGALAAADVLVLPSRSEGLPGVLIEAAFTGLPVVASDVGSVREIVLPGQTGLLVPPQDEDALAGALGAALAHRARFGLQGREHCLARFNLPIVAQAWDALLTTLLEAAP
jgi:glycosyltransferase involved in cell wall biosynthesis